MKGIVMERLERPRFAAKPSIGQLPQRFMYTAQGEKRFGVCLPNPDGSWTATTGQGVTANFNIDLDVALRIIMGNAYESFEWIDRGFQV